MSKMSQQDNRLAISIKNQCTNKQVENDTNIYKLPLVSKSTFEGASSVIRRFSFGETNRLAGKTASKTILVMGATGSGKTTWINAMVNYVLGVEWEDDFRFKLVNEVVKGASQAHSQTQEITAYDLHYRDGFRIPYSLTIVDTPGFGDTQGMKRDKEITTAVQEFFNHQNGIQELNVVGFVVQSSLARLTPSQKYIFNSVLEIFGKDIGENILFLTTFSDGDEPKVLAAIKEAKLPCKLDANGLPCYKRFNNYVIYKSPKPGQQQKKLCFDFEESIENFESFFKELSNMEPKSLQMTKEVLSNRKQLEVKLKWVEKNIPKHLMKMEELRQIENLIDVHKAKVDAHQHFEVEVMVTKKVRGPVAESNNNLNCRKCKVTCHYPCDPNLPIGWCEGFTVQNQSTINKFLQKVVNTFREANCTICPGKCSSSDHESENSGWIYKQVKETQTLDEMRQKYEKAKGMALDAEGMRRALRDEVEKLKLELVQSVNCITHLHKQLENTALCAGGLSTPDYIKMMIQNEEKERAEGFQERVVSLKELLKLSELKDKILTNEEFKDQFNSIK